MRALLALALLPAAAGAYSDGPPPAHTGGFGEPDCSGCHFAPPADAGGAELHIEGVPEHYRPGERYRLGVTLQANGPRRGGFSLSARDERGAQAGELKPGKDVLSQSMPGLVYVGHATPADGLPANWTLEWKAPERCAGTVHFHLAANAANGDDSALGDVVVRAVAVSHPPRHCND